MIEGLEEAAADGGGGVPRRHRAGEERHVVTAGGRVLAVSARGDSVADARARAYAAAELVRFDGRQMRGDIAAGNGAAT